MSCKTIYVMISSFLSEEEKMIVAAHELGHIILHRSQLKMAPMQDDTLYNMTDNTEYQANLFAADLLIDDEEIEDMVQNEDLDYFGLCSSLNATPELMSFKLYSLTKRGQASSSVISRMIVGIFSNPASLAACILRCPEIIS